VASYAELIVFTHPTNNNGQWTEEAERLVETSAVARSATVWTE